MEREQHEMRVTELSATKQRLEESLASLRTEASSSAREAAQLKKECEELKGTVQLQAGRLEEAQRSINALQGLVGLSAPNAAGSGMLGTIRAVSTSELRCCSVLVTCMDDHSLHGIGLMVALCNVDDTDPPAAEGRATHASVPYKKALHGFWLLLHGM